ncbi:phosphocholine-specific phospholipase C [Acidicapsa dinghuensis]|uniref:phospholipase C n=1 Tax=Acidicapsa dinghuensis TaxID=2218256 RepID=A0ABW1EMJ0_9BACT|nr:phospholipase C, phosphocholine-specific [Acidicapsa dinghuensis]
MATDRRTFLQLLTTSAAAATFPVSIARALEIPANNRTRSIRDVEHIVILMQENRSFDHYFGTLRGVRGFGDPRVAKLPNGDPLWYQPNGSDYVLPFHPGAPSLGLQFLQDLAHDWTTTHAAWNNGQHDQWVPQKGTTTMAHLTRSDIPFHYALADAFTICDAYHCSLLGPTDPNRYYMWTGWVGNDGNFGGPVIDNAELGYDWHTYPERLQSAGVSWKIYQDQGAGLDAAHFWGWGEDAYIGNYGDNSLLYFHQYQNAPANSPLARRARTGTNISASGTLFDQFRNDVQSGKLPQVSWIVAPEAYTEHPNWPANYGAWYVSQMLDALTSNPEVWSKTVFLLTYDENDGFFDHALAPTVPTSRANGISTIDTANEIFNGAPSYPTSEYPAGPYGMGIRVPMLAISPWSKGGWVNSEVFDHTSIIRFIEARFGREYPGINEPNITPWRRAVSGDLTSTFNFQSPNDAKVKLPSTIAYIPPDNNRHPDYIPAPPTEQSLPTQEPGTRPARALPYELHVHGEADLSSGSFRIHFGSAGKTAVYQVRSGNSPLGPWTYTVGTGAEVSDIWPIAAQNLSAYDLAVYGPNGFLRSFKGSITGNHPANLDVRAAYDIHRNGITLTIRNLAHATEVRIADAYTGDTFKSNLKSGEILINTWYLDHSHGWYDLTVSVESDSYFAYQFAGHVETGQDSITDPAIARIE